MGVMYGNTPQSFERVALHGSVMMSDANISILTDVGQVPAIFTDAFVYWQNLCDGAWAPDPSTFKLDELPAALLPWSILVDVEKGLDDFHYRYWGTERAILIGAEMTGKRTSDIAEKEMREANVREYCQVCEARTAILCQTPVVTPMGRRSVFQSIRLPLSGDGETVTRIYSAINYQQISSASYEFYGTDPYAMRM